MGDIERLVAEANDGTVDDAFLQHLARGGELLSSNRVVEARDVLEQAWRLHPKNQKAQNLLGLTYFKLGTFDRAAEIYELLVRDNPVDPTLRVNLGLVYLKQNALQRAMREFETAVDLAPDHKKAQNYLGLAYAQAGDFSRAKDCFVAAGSLTMAEKMERALKDPARALQVSLPGAGAQPAAVAAAEPAASLTEKIRAARDTGEIEVDIDVDSPETAPEQRPGEIDASAWAADAEPAPMELSPPPEEPVQAHAAAAEPVAAPQAEAWAQAYAPTLSELTRALVVGAPDAQGPFAVTADSVLVRVEGEVLTRIEGLLAAVGSVQYYPEMKRFRGKATDKAFGDGERRVVRASGTGTLVFAPRDRVFVPIELADESAYFREDFVFAFEESVVFENGRVPSKLAPDLHLVHLRGKGKVLLAVPAALRTVGVVSGAPCAVPMSVLVGWHGPLTPRIVGISEEREGVATLAAVELSGDGFAILTGIKAQP